MEKNRQKRWVKVQDFYIHTNKDQKGIQRYIQRLKASRRRVSSVSLLQERDLEIFND